MTDEPDPRPMPAHHPWIATVLAAVPVAAAAYIGNRATLPEIATWYAGLVKPSFNPPNWIFGPVWTALYLMMILAFRRILLSPAVVPGQGLAIGLFLAQTALNALWSVAFFGFHAPLAGIVVIGFLDVALALTIRAFAAIDRPAALLLAPYMAWISYATLLNTAVWWLNR